MGCAISWVVLLCLAGLVVFGDLWWVSVGLVVLVVGFDYAARLDFSVMSLVFC